LLDFLFAKGKEYSRIEIVLVNGLGNVIQIALESRISVFSLLLGGQRIQLLKVLVLQLALTVFDQHDFLVATHIGKVLQRCWSVVCVDDIDAVQVFHFGNPLGQFRGIGRSGRQQAVSDIFGSKNDRLFPDDASVFVF
jgi:hypothetical protein